MKRLLIDLMKCRNCDKKCALCEEYVINKTKGVKNLIEAASYAITCRRCEDSPCINVCTQDALEKDGDGKVQRYINRCVGCKSCVIACPFGTIPEHIVNYTIPKSTIFKIGKEGVVLSLISKCPEKAVEFTEEEASSENHIYEIADKVLVKDHHWKEFIK